MRLACLALIEYALCVPCTAPERSKPDWDIDAAISTYNVDGWGSGYFSVNARRQRHARSR